MTIVKNRGNKRSSGSVFSPTATIAIFVTLCIVGVYMLSTTSNASPESDEGGTSTSTSTKTSSYLGTRAGSSRRKSDTEDTDSSSFQDNPGNLPGDSTKTDDPDRSSSGSTDSGKDDDDKDENNEDSDEKKKQSDDETQTSEDPTKNDNSRGDSNGDGSQETDSNETIKSEHESDGIVSEDQMQHDETPTKTYEDSTHQLEEETLHNESKNSQKNSSQESGGNKGEFPNTGSTGIPKESQGSEKTWSTQKMESENQKDRGSTKNQETRADTQNWNLCNVTAGQDYIPCLDNEAAIARLRSRSHFQHRERHCPDQGPTCLVPLPPGYKTPVKWPQSRDKIWYANVPQTTLAQVKGHQNWVKVTGEFLTFPGGGTQFIHGASHYIDFIESAWPEIAWGNHTRVILDVGCGVASFGGFLFDRDVLAISFAPKDEHTAQVQFALERGIPAISAVMGTTRLSFPSKVFDLVHCARCRVPWHADGGALLLELNRVLRPGGHFVWSATPVYQTLEEDVQIWKEMSALTEAMCWKLVSIKKDKLNQIGAAIYKKPTSNDCYETRETKAPPMCKTNDDPNAAWYVPLQSCMYKVPTEENDRGTKWPVEWPKRLTTPPYWLDKSQTGFYGKPAPDDFTADYEHWKKLVHNTYLNGLGISWTDVRNVMDMRSVYGGFAAVLKDMKLWVMNVVNIDAPDTLPIIYDRGFFGMYHDWCESFSTYPRTYDLLHADHLFSTVKKRCKIDALIVEIDRVLRPRGKLIVRDESSVIDEVEKFLRSLHWEIRMTFSKNQQGFLSAEKTQWRPDTYEDSS